MSLYELAIVDDQVDQTDALAETVGSLAHDDGSQFRITRFTDAGRFVSWLDEGGRPDIVLMDIMLGGGRREGIDLAGELNLKVPGAQVVFVTGYIECCTAVYETDHVYFLTKPVNPDDLRRALRKAVQAVEKRRRDRIEIRFKGRSSLLDVNMIDFIESAGRKVRIHCLYGEIDTYARLGELSERLPASFVRCHKSFIVNLARVASFGSELLVLRSGAEVPVSKSRQKETRAAWDRHLLETL